MPYKILYTADLHGNERFYEKLFEKGKGSSINSIVIGGDLCPRGGSTIKEAINFQKKFLESFLMPKIKNFEKDVFLIMGNDDFRINMKSIENSEIENLKLIHKNLNKIGSKNIIGYSFVNPTPFRLKDWEKFEDGKKEEPERVVEGNITSTQREEGTIQQDFETLKKLSNPKSTIYVTHAPPFNTKLDIINAGAHVGSKAIRKFIEKEQPPLTMHGHIHESPKMSGSYIDKINNTICINVGSSYPKDLLNCIVIDISSFDMKYMEL